MMTRDMVALVDWQIARAEGLTPAQRMERLLRETFKSRDEVRYEDQVDVVRTEMAR